MPLERRLLLLLVIGSCAARAQLVPPDPDWREVEAPPAPPVRTTGLLPIEVPGTSLRFGVDPDSITLDRDGVVRYVMVASSGSGAVNASYEGIRCATGEFKVYARQGGGGGWMIVKDTRWQALSQQTTARHTMEIARTGACVGHAPNRSPGQIVRDLKAPVDRRFNIN